MATMNTLSFANIPQATASNNHLRTVFQSFATVYLRTSVDSDSTQNILASDADWQVMVTISDRLQALSFLIEVVHPHTQGSQQGCKLVVSF